MASMRACMTAANRGISIILLAGTFGLSSPPAHLDDPAIKFLSMCYR